MIAATCDPPPASTVKTPGPVLSNGTCTPVLDCPRVVDRTVNVTRPVPNCVGSCALISVGEVLRRGSATSLAVTQTPPSNCGSGLPFAVAVSARFVPRIVTSDPGDSCGFLLALLITPFAVNDGARPVEAASDTMLKPDTVRT